MARASRTGARNVHSWKGVRWGARSGGPMRAATAPATPGAAGGGPVREDRSTAPGAGAPRAEIRRYYKAFGRTTADVPMSDTPAGARASPAAARTTPRARASHRAWAAWRAPAASSPAPTERATEAVVP